MQAVLLALLMFGGWTDGVGRFTPHIIGQAKVVGTQERHARATSSKLDVTSPTASLRATLRR